MKKSIKLTILAAVFFLLSSAPVHAVSIIGDSELLDMTSAGQLETWLDDGELTLRNIYTRNISSDSMSDLHSAVDGQGPTMIVLNVNVNGTEFTVGGYNPLSWASTGGYNYTYNSNDYDAFIYNLSTDYVVHQSNAYQTHNYYDRLAFGAGHDLLIRDIGTSWTSYSYSYTYQDLDNDGVDDFSTNGWSTGLYNTGGYFTISGLEVFTVETSPVPEPATMLLLGSGFAGMAGFRRKLKKS